MNNTSKALSVLLLSGSFLSVAHAVDRNILWDKVHNQCEPQYKADGKYTPCSLVDEHDGYVIYKGDSDKYQYLLLPTKQITGIEDEQLLADNQPNYIYLSWEARDLVAEKTDRKVREQDISLTVNSLNTRSQDQLHVHISCLAQPVREALDRMDVKNIDNDWHVFPEPLKTYTFNYKKLSFSELKNRNIFKDVSDKVAADGGELQYSTFAVVNLDSDNFMILEASGTLEKRIGAEKLQDHTCALAQ
ncbi:CDP-diacylglycerol diphosphatase [Erwinia sp. HDF1-3R]|uniref:CDP-diacylglycerol diphosphatase n=1 Tax=Erwinia sp. HDF1-3R TaxID=3141543 RepID=UPI0031F59685